MLSLLPILLLVMCPVVAAMPLILEEADIDGNGLIIAGKATNANTGIFGL